MKQGHRWLWQILNWSVCSHCGLIRLKNRATEKAANAACPGDDD